MGYQFWGGWNMSLEVWVPTFDSLNVKTQCTLIFHELSHVKVACSTWLTIDHAHTIRVNPF